MAKFVAAMAHRLRDGRDEFPMTVTGKPPPGADSERTAPALRAFLRPHPHRIRSDAIPYWDTVIQSSTVRLACEA
jgi:hypothetical protein